MNGFLNSIDPQSSAASAIPNDRVNCLDCCLLRGLSDSRSRFPTGQGNRVDFSLREKESRNQAVCSSPVDTSVSVSTPVRYCQRLARRFPMTQIQRPITENVEISNRTQNGSGTIGTFQSALRPRCQKRPTTQPVTANVVQLE
jgi:hypothetical protein